MFVRVTMTIRSLNSTVLVQQSNHRKKASSFVAKPPGLQILAPHDCVDVQCSSDAAIGLSNQLAFLKLASAVRTFHSQRTVVGLMS